MEKKILIIDDDKNFTEIVKTSLEGSGEYQVIVENKGTNGCHAARKLKSDLILLDIMMPRMDGFEVLEELRAHRRSVHIPVVMLTSTDDKVYKEKAQRLDANDYLVKPINPEDLKSKIEKILSRRGR